MKQLREANGRFKSKGIERLPNFDYMKEYEPLGFIVKDQRKINEIIDELNALKAWKEKKQSEDFEELAKKVQKSFEEEEAYRRGTYNVDLGISEETKIQLGTMLYDWKYHSDKTMEYFREEIIALLRGKV